MSSSTHIIFHDGRRVTNGYISVRIVVYSAEAGTVNWEGHVSSIVLYWFSYNMRVSQSGQSLEGYL